MRIRIPAIALLWLQASVAYAQIQFQNDRLQVNTTPGGTAYAFWTIIGRIIQYLTGAIGAVAVTMFVVGALLVTLSGVKEDLRQKGKDLMIGSVLSLAIVLGAYALLRMVEYFLTA